MEKHYDGDYLEYSSKITAPVKEYSYTFFKNIFDGVIIDLGCGPGIDVKNLSLNLNNDVKIYGLDHDAKMIELAKKNIAKTNIEFIHSEADNLAFEDNAVDGLRIERVVQHLLNPKAVIEEAYRVLKKDAPLVVIETDWIGITFYTPYIDIERKIQNYLTEKKVNNGLASREILLQLTNQGFKNIKEKVFPLFLNSLQEINNLFKIDEIINEMENESFLSKKETATFRSFLKKADQLNCLSSSIDLILFSIIK